MSPSLRFLVLSLLEFNSIFFSILFSVKIGTVGLSCASTLRRIAAGPMLVVYRKGWPQSARYALSGIILQIINWAFCPATVTGHSSGGNTVLPQAFPYLPCDCTSMGAGASHGKASSLLPFISTGAAGFVLF